MRRERRSNGDEVHLHGMLEQFRTALQAEIEAARRGVASNAVPIINGRRIAKIGGSFQYIFDIENVLNLPGDTPGDLKVPDHVRMEIVIISIEGMTITISVPEDLGPFVPKASLQSDLTFLMKILIERIESLSDKENPAGDRILGGIVSGEPVSIQPDEQLNSEQIDAIASSLGRDTTFIWGPPGTGKTKTIGAIGRELYKRGRSVLLVSHTNIAVDQAMLRIGEKTEKAELAKGRILRVGDTKDKRFEDEKNKELLLETHVDRRSTELAEKRDKLTDERKVIVPEVIKLARKIEICEWLTEARSDIDSMTEDMAELEIMERDLDNARNEKSELERFSTYWATAQDEAKRARSHIDQITALDQDIAKVEEQIAEMDRECEDVSLKLYAEEALYDETKTVGWLRRRWRGLPSPEAQLLIVENFKAELQNWQIELNGTQGKLVNIKKDRANLTSGVETFCKKYSGAPDYVLAKAHDHIAEHTRLRDLIAELNTQCKHCRHSLSDLLRVRIAALSELGLTKEECSSVEMMLSSVQDAFLLAASEVDDADLNQLKASYERLNDRISTIDAKIEQIEEELKRVEEIVISNATVIATTLTRAYLRDTIQSRRFDTVILDEASMAPIPALWVAASLADKNAVVVGDFKQLPPIVISEHNLAQRWLGTDIFEEAKCNNTNSFPPFLVPLHWQYRMHPDISAIPNELIYQHSLKNDEKTLSDGKLADWYDCDWGYDEPVLLVDTGSLGAWVTSVVRGQRKASRLNFLSATICMDIVERLLKVNRTTLSPGESPRILIVCPYRPHAQLLSLLIREQDLTNDVKAGTAHSFQGTEADVVIFDLVNDAPHWRVGQFIPAYDQEVKKLLNVALTRAKRRLMVVGDFEYIIKHSKKAFIGRELIPFLLRYPRVNAIDVVPKGFAARAAEAQTTVYGGKVEPDANRIFVTQDRFYPLLHNDLASAKNRVIFYSPFLTKDRLGHVAPQMRAALERGVDIYVVTKSHCDRKIRELSNYRMLENTLTEWGVIIIHKRRMHEKIVLIDDDIIWLGSLNPLSYSDTQEVMERRKSNAVVKDIADTLRLKDLISEYDHGSPKCPICGFEIVASEGKDKPFYWFCVNEECNYTRDIDQPPLKGGIITCANCGAKVEFGSWGKNPAWRCVDNYRHHQKIARTHLQLPKMRGMIPQKELKELDKRFGINNLKIESDRHGGRDQVGLFDNT